MHFSLFLCLLVIYLINLRNVNPTNFFIEIIANTSRSEFIKSQKTPFSSLLLSTISYPIKTILDHEFTTPITPPNNYFYNVPLQVSKNAANEKINYHRPDQDEILSFNKMKLLKIGNVTFYYHLPRKKQQIL